MKATKDQRRKEAEERNAKWAAMTHIAQLAHLNEMFGKDKGAAKQRAKIAKQIDIAKVASAKKKDKKKA